MAGAEIVLPSSPLVSRVKRSILLKEDKADEDIEDIELGYEQNADIQDHSITQSIDDREVVQDSEEETRSLKRCRPSTPPQPYTSTSHVNDPPLTTEIPSSPSPIVSSSPSLSPPPLLNSPSLPSHEAQLHSRFRFSHPSNITGTPASYPISTSRPSFVLPPAPLEGEKPIQLPEAFSPHRQRRGVKYIPEGLAATVRDWALDVSNISRGRSRTEAVQNEELATVLEAAGVRVGAKMALLACHDNHRNEKKFSTNDIAGGEEEREPKMWLLIGERNDGMGQGSRVEVKKPTWDIQLGEQNWGVGLDWKVLN